MDFEAKREVALKELSESGVQKANFRPPVLVLAWKLGLKLRPPHYNTFWANTLFNGCWFCVLWGFAMWFLIWRNQGMPVLGALLAALFAGFLFGSMMAVYYRWSARKCRLTPWEEINDTEPQSAE
ncbi:DUF6404 family protein [Marinimicrobium agarilyticum]|uniref:DUF6404 family protein n=1 Tax=Marinimicrobium agarilyticum TaxID=306546 RepID=UPI000488AE69|nr:DUF6404 family protein [Marinimicrobium agarilyticum]